MDPYQPPAAGNNPPFPRVLRGQNFWSGMWTVIWVSFALSGLWFNIARWSGLPKGPVFVPLLILGFLILVNIWRVQRRILSRLDARFFEAANLQARLAGIVTWPVGGRSQLGVAVLTAEKLLFFPSSLAPQPLISIQLQDIDNVSVKGSAVLLRNAPLRSTQRFISSQATIWKEELDRLIGQPPAV